MAKHIIMLTLCFMAYIIGNVNAKDDASRKGEFELAVKCYEQMFENGLIKGIPDLQKSETDTFQTVLTNFYTAYQVETVKNENGDIIPTLNNHQFNTDRALDSFRREFIHDFIQKGTDDVLKGHITTLTAKMSRGELNDYPLRVFVLKYEPTSHTEYLRSTSAFCRKFSECPSFENALNEAVRKEKFELAVKCYEQMFENGLIKGIPDLQKSETDTFKTVLTNFYTAYHVETVRNDNGDIIPTLNNHQFKTDEELDSFRREFTNDFLQKGSDDIFKGHISALTSKISQGQLNDYPLRVFVLKYEPTSNTDYLRSTSAFCRKYSECPSFENKH